MLPTQRPVLARARLANTAQVVNTAVLRARQAAIVNGLKRKAAPIATGDQARWARGERKLAVLTAIWLDAIVIRELAESRSRVM
jgi:hypothetical protein